MKRSDTSLRHLQFIYHSGEEMNTVMKSTMIQVHTLWAEATEVFHYLTDNYDIQNVLSYQESGVLETWNRDREAAALFDKKGINWIQFKKAAVMNQFIHQP